jgi:hypothetical protein
VWYASPRHFRLAVPSSLSESDVIRDGSTAWLWPSRCWPRSGRPPRSA